jgi:hypothetical protein
MVEGDGLQLVSVSVEDGALLAVVTVMDSDSVHGVREEVPATIAPTIIEPSSPENDEEETPTVVSH